jgi:hypothetical protein
MNVFDNFVGVIFEINYLRTSKSNFLFFISLLSLKGVAIYNQRRFTAKKKCFLIQLGHGLKSSLADYFFVMSDFTEEFYA